MTTFSGPEKSIADIIAEARAYLEKNGWWKGSLRGPNGRQVCSMGAIMYSQGIHNLDSRRAAEVGTAVMRGVRALHPEVRNVLDITCWNDSEAKNKQDVLDCFAKAEKIERAGFDPDEGIVP